MSTTTELINFNQLATVPAMIEDGKQGLAKAKEVVAKFPEVDSDEMDAQAVQLITRIKASLESRYNARMPFTRQLDEIKKEFTANENGFKELQSELQKKRDGYAQFKLAQKRKADEEAAEKLKDEQEKIREKHLAEQAITDKINELLIPVKKYAYDVLNKVTKANLEESKALLSKPVQWKHPELKFSQPDIDRFITLATETLSGTHDILEVAIKNKKDAAKLQEIADQEAADRKAQEEADAKAKSEADQILLQLDAERSAEVKVKESVTIEVRDNSDWLKMIAFWFEHDPEAKGKDLSKKTFAQCKAFCEKYALKHDKTIDGLIYNEVIKAA